MYKTVKDAKDLFESITSLRVEGTEFYKASEILDAILREAHTGYNLCKDALDSACFCRYPYLTNIGGKTACANCLRLRR